MVEWSVQSIEYYYALRALLLFIHYMIGSEYWQYSHAIYLLNSENPCSGNIVCETHILALFLPTTISVLPSPLCLAQTTFFHLKSEIYRWNLYCTQLTALVSMTYFKYTYIHHTSYIYMILPSEPKFLYVLAITAELMLGKHYWLGV